MKTRTEICLVLLEISRRFLKLGRAFVWLYLVFLGYKAIFLRLQHVQIDYYELNLLKITIVLITQLHESDMKFEFYINLQNVTIITMFDTLSYWFCQRCWCFSALFTKKKNTQYVNGISVWLLPSSFYCRRNKFCYLILGMRTMFVCDVTTTSDGYVLCP